MTLRLRQVLSLIDIKPLFNHDILPDLWKFPTKGKNQLEYIDRFPKEYKDKRPEYGIYIEEQLYLGLAGKDHNGGKGCQLVIDSLLGIGLYRDKELKHPQYLIVGHPDLYCNDVIVEVKTTEYWEGMRRESIAQLFGYAALSNISQIGIALPMSGKILWYDATKWLQTSATKYLEFLNNVVKIVHYGPTLYAGLGHHVSKEIACNPKTKSTELPHTMQVFIGNPKSTKLTLTDTQTAVLINLSQTNKIYVHAPYVLLPSNRAADDYVAKCLIEHLDAIRHFSTGLVVHIGSGTIENIRHNLALIESAINEKCPLLLETSCNEGGEILANPEDLLELYLTLDPKKFGICVDVCHTAAAGYCPFEAIKMFDYISKGSVRLVHFNNSAAPYGSCVDKHARYGFVESEKMFSIKQYCIDNKIDMVCE